jgi:hypothetical protein
MRRHPTAPVNVARISVATSGTDFTTPEEDFAVLIRAAGFCPGRSHLSRGSCRSWDGAWSAPGRKADVDVCALDLASLHWLDLAQTSS